MLEINSQLTRLKDLQTRTDSLRGYLDYDEKKDRLAEVELELGESSVWDKPEYAQALGKERSSLEIIVGTIDKLNSGIAEVGELLSLAQEEDDEELFDAANSDLEGFQQDLEKLEFRRMFSGDMDEANAYLEIQAGSGGTEAQDWAEMLLRMYLRWGESKGFKTELIEVSGGDVAGIKSATLHISGEFAFGWLRTETGVHRLVRKSPFDSGSRRHTSFASVFVSPEINDDIEVDLDMSMVRIDTYRSSGAGGQHVNKTDSAVRLTHEPSGIVVQCQNQRSQHKNKDMAIKQLKAKLYEMEELKRKEEAQDVEESKADIGWGSQIRSYVLDASRIKDLRTNIEVTNTGAVLDGDLDKFIEASLKMGL
ncbi:MAG: peptide chain release factor 2 [Gammaproteobacteria bacterium]|nr:peptide chain release factor 2 [Gammaproteobacteria bacterium]MBT3858674.1 peptide chain release factor 2 [Gammaproteobacteria bacterium]MBT3986026.1 peptide chain release factor 2 [Gammaproteobacteria bacterium]MBT4255859.1 peptide chain release factor 2 [Gammaproteobacteria bacterium]MBT4582388.1 peptide chain release factor 2 [Gammaproteobacteria bacterium]